MASFLDKFFKEAGKQNKSIELNSQIEIIPKDKLEEKFDDITKTLLTTEEMSKNQYKNFINSYISYMFSREGLKGCSVVMDDNFKEDSNVLACVKPGGNRIYLNPHFFNKPQKIENVFENIATLEHECQHIIDSRGKGKKAKHVNKNNIKMFGFGFHEEYKCLLKLLGKKYEKVLQSIRTLNYVRDDMEVTARVKGRVRLKVLSDNMQKIISKNNIYDNELAKKNLKSLNQVYEKHDNNEKILQENYKIIYNQSSPVLKQMNKELTEKLKKLKVKDIDIFYGTSTLVRALGMAGVLNQQNFDILAEKIDYQNFEPYYDGKLLLNLINQNQYARHEKLLEDAFVQTAQSEIESNTNNPTLCKNIERKLFVLEEALNMHDLLQQDNNNGFNIIYFTPEKCKEARQKVQQQYVATPTPNATPIAERTFDKK